MVHFHIFKVSTRRLFTLLSTTILFALVIWLLNHVTSYRGVWENFYTEKIMNSFFCERTDMSNIIRQPINTFSNFIYWISALAILRRGWKDQSKRNRYNIISANPFYSITFGFILLYIFCASVFFHSSLILFASDLDFSAVYSLSLFPLMYFTHRIWLLKLGIPSNQKHPRSTRTLIVIFSTIYLLLSFFLPEEPRNYVVLGLIILLIIFGILVERYDPGKTNHRYLAISIGSISFAVMWFIFDVYKIYCNPDSFLQPHSLWHLFSGIAAFYFYMYIRSEKNKI